MDENEKKLNNLINKIETCPNCKAVVNGDKFCHNCGKKLVGTEDSENRYDNPPPPPPPIENRTSPFMVFIAILSIATAIIVVGYLLNNINKEYDDNMKWLNDTIEESEKYRFNCPNCQKYLAVTKENMTQDIFDDNVYTYRCPNCNRTLRINTLNDQVTLTDIKY